MRDKDCLLDIAGRLIESWNSHNLARILQHYDEDIQATNPLFRLLLGKHDGVLRGKQALRPYWVELLNQMPHLYFKLHDVYLGVDSFVIHYQGIFERNIAEVFKLNNEGLITETVSYFESLEMP